MLTKLSIIDAKQGKVAFGSGKGKTFSHIGGIAVSLFSHGRRTRLI